MAIASDASWGVPPRVPMPPTPSHAGGLPPHHAISGSTHVLGSDTPSPPPIARMIAHAVGTLSARNSTHANTTQPNVRSRAPYRAPGTTAPAGHRARAARHA